MLTPTIWGGVGKAETVGVFSPGLTVSRRGMYTFSPKNQNPSQYPASIRILPKNKGSSSKPMGAASFCGFPFLVV